MPNQYRPTGVTLNRKNATLEIGWDDGRLSAYSLRDLREACPCAQCRAETTSTAKLADSNLLVVGRARDYLAKSVELVGNYALQVEWGDGHRTGIYTWPYLRDLDRTATEEAGHG